MSTTSRDWVTHQLDQVQKKIGELPDWISSSARVAGGAVGTVKSSGTTEAPKDLETKK